MKILGPGWPQVERHTLRRPSEGAGQRGGGEAYLCAHTNAERSRAVSSKQPRSSLDFLGLSSGNLVNKRTQESNLCLLRFYWARSILARTVYSAFKGILLCGSDDWVPSRHLKRNAVTSSHYSAGLMPYLLWQESAT